MTKILILLAGIGLGALLVLTWPGDVPVQAAPSAAPLATTPAAEPTTENCEKGASAEGESLYLCNVAGAVCVWDPSPALGAGVMSCDW